MRPPVPFAEVPRFWPQFLVGAVCACNMRQVLSSVQHSCVETAGNQPCADAANICCLLPCFLQRTCMRLGSWHGSASPASWLLKVGRRVFWGPLAGPLWGMHRRLRQQSNAAALTGNAQSQMISIDFVEILSLCAELHYGEVFEQVALLQCRPPIPPEMPTDYAGVCVCANRQPPGTRRACMRTAAHLPCPSTSAHSVGTCLFSRNT